MARASAMAPVPHLGEIDDLIGAFLDRTSSASVRVTGRALVADGGLLGSLKDG